MANISPEEHFAEALHMAAHAWKLALDRRLKPLGLSRSAWMALATVARSASSLTQTEIASIIGVEDPSVVALIDRLESSGLVSRTPKPEDRRVKLIELTAAGRELFKKIRHEAAANRREILAGLPATDIETALAVLEQIREKAEAAR